MYVRTCVFRMVGGRRNRETIGLFWFGGFVVAMKSLASTLYPHGARRPVRPSGVKLRVYIEEECTLLKLLLCRIIHTVSYTQ